MSVHLPHIPFLSPLPIPSHFLLRSRLRRVRRVVRGVTRGEQNTENPSRLSILLPWFCCLGFRRLAPPSLPRHPRRYAPLRGLSTRHPLAAQREEEGRRPGAPPRRSTAPPDAALGEWVECGVGKTRSGSHDTRKQRGSRKLSQRLVSCHSLRFSY